MFADLTRAVRRYLRDSRAGATAYTAVGVTVMTLAGTALIVDHDHLVGQRDLLQSAADAASLSAMLELEGLPEATTDADARTRLLAVARKYAVLNVLGNTNDPDLTAADIRVTLLDMDREEGTVAVAVEADIGKTLMSEWLLGYSGPGSVVRKSGVEQFKNPVEVVLAIDISLSMEKALDGGFPHEAYPEFNLPANPSRMAIVKQAAKDLVDILDPKAENRVAVGVVPWQRQVRLDDAAKASWVANGWASYPTSRNYAVTYLCKAGSCTAPDEDQTLPSAPGEAWLGCLEEHRILTGDRAALPADGDLLDPPSETAFAQAFFVSGLGFAHDCRQSPFPDDFSWQYCYGENAANAGGKTSWMEPQFGCKSIGSDGRYTDDPVPAILPLTSDSAAIKAAIDSLGPVGGSTRSALGILWGQRLLSHSWKDVWGGAVHPVDPGTLDNEGTRKAIVLLTDGEDNQCGFYDPDCEDSNLGVGRAAACATAKDAGAEVFVIAAMHPDNVSGTLGTALEACSSKAQKPEGTYVFLNNQDPASLKAAFTDIATQLSTVRRIY